MAFLNNESFTISAVSAILMIATGCSVVCKKEALGEYFDGSAITAKSKTKLVNDRETSATSIKIKTIEEGGSTLKLYQVAKGEGSCRRVDTLHQPGKRSAQQLEGMNISGQLVYLG